LTGTHASTVPFRMASLRPTIGLSPVLRLLATRLVFLRFPFSDALFVPDRPHSELAVGARYAAEVSSGEIGKHSVALEAQAPTQSGGVQDLIFLGHLYTV
jgi:hypothetical protein